MVNKKSKAINKDKDYEQMGRQLEALYDSVNPKKGALYKTALLKGILGGVGGVIGATLVISLLLWILSLFEYIPVLDQLFESTRRTIENKE